MSIYILDTETTNNKPPMEVIEVAWEKVTLNEFGQEVIFDKDSFNESIFVTESVFHKLWYPEEEISFGAMATHGILKDHLVQELPSSDVKKYLPHDLDYLIGHNIIFDWKAIGKPECKRICTLSLARYVYPEAETHKLGALLFYTFEREDWARATLMLKQAHSALADVSITRRVLNHLVRKLVEKGDLASNFTIEELYKFSQEIYIPKIITFGKWAGSSFEEIPFSYIQWLINQPNLDEPLELALRKEFKSRTGSIFQ